MAIVTLLATLDRRSNTTEDDVSGDENIVQDEFIPISERLSTSDTIDVVYSSSSTLVWGNGDLTASANTFISFTNVS